jgi:phage protein U
MYSQLGNIIFDGLFSPESFSRSDTTSYAMHSLVSGKPRLQPIANDLEEISMTLRLRAEFCNVTETVTSLKTAKDRFEVMPLITGSGRYFGDFVILSLSETHTQAFEDGALLEASVDVSLREFVTPDKLLQQQQAARKRGFAVAKKPVNTGLLQLPTAPQLASKNVSVMSSEAKSIDNQVINYENNVSQRAFISKDIERSIKNVQTHLEEYNKQITGLQDAVGSDYTTIQQAATTMQAAANGFVFPVTSIEDLRQSNLKLQSASNSLRSANTIIDLNVITRRL